MKEKKVLLISVGGSPNPIIFSIECNKCEHIIFFCSRDTLSELPAIREKVADKVKIIDYEKIVTENYEDIGTCYRAIVQRLPEILSMWQFSYDDVVIDYTGGTKAMSAALVLATVSNCNNYSYIGGGTEDKTVRTKEGRGTVIDGKEKFYYQQNPWDALGIGELKIIDNLFSKARYAAAVEKLQQLKQSVDSKLRDLYGLLASICEAYYFWDIFKLREARNLFANNFPRFEKYSLCGTRDLENLIIHISRNIEYLNHLTSSVMQKNEAPAEAYLLLAKDLISNAIRRAEKEDKYEDAVARLYSACEKIVKGKLLGYGIDNSRTRKDQIPVLLADRFEKYKYFNEKKNNWAYKYGFDASCELLAARDPEFASKYSRQKDNLKNLMSRRNDSILAHGTTPVTENTYKDMLDATLKFAELERNELVEFPELKLNSWGPVLLR
jgi:CRISPR-associated protein (TIGR02710 family)